jgi:hypothetical protein
MTDFYKGLLNVAKTVQDKVDEQFLPPPETTLTRKHNVLPYSLFQGTRGYLEKIVSQINITYEQACYDACAVMIRRLVEILIIESFEHNGIENKIKNTNGEFLHLEELIGKTISESKWNLGRNTKRYLGKLKDIGDLSAHTRRYNAQRTDIDKLTDGLRVAVEELLYLSGLRK